MKILLMEMSRSMVTCRCVSWADWLMRTYRCCAGTLVRIRLGVFWMSASRQKAQCKSHQGSVFIFIYAGMEVSLSFSLKCTKHFLSSPPPHPPTTTTASPPHPHLALLLVFRFLDFSSDVRFRYLLRKPEIYKCSFLTSLV